MYKILLGCSVVMLTVAAAPASADAGAKGAGAAVASGVAANGQVAPVSGGDGQAVAEKKVCKHLPSSYSRRTQRVCLTTKEWTQVEREAQ